MSLRIALTFASFLCATAFAQESTNGIFLSMKVEQGGTQVANPRLLLQDAVPAEIQIGAQLKIQVTATNESNSTDLRMKVFAEEGSGLGLVGTPRVLVTYGQESVVSWLSASGVAYKLTLTPRLVALPAKS